ncbi:hypothetical protein ABT160_28545 [Streptomyces sp. NPDC001941]|uniref:hypothetical protein n=1 Tax=Streptomyces sp. NPDC001941 TaxID=3154659 RepID=UPI0033277992
MTIPAPYLARPLTLADTTRAVDLVRARFDWARLRQLSLPDQAYRRALRAGTDVVVLCDGDDLIGLLHLNHQPEPDTWSRLEPGLPTLAVTFALTQPGRDDRPAQLLTAWVTNYASLCGYQRVRTQLPHRHAAPEHLVDYLTRTCGWQHVPTPAGASAAQALLEIPARYLTGLHLLVRNDVPLQIAPPPPAAPSGAEEHVLAHVSHQPQPPPSPYLLGTRQPGGAC